MGLFDRYYYGKAGKRDYTEMDQPKTRVGLFFRVFKDHVFDLIKVNLLQLIFWLPFLLWTFINLASLQSLEITAGQEAEASEMVSGLIMMWFLGLVPCILITGPSSAGSAYIMRSWAKDQHAFLFSDFKDAFKSNWKKGLLTSAITSVVPVLAYTAFRFYSGMSKSNPVLLVPLVFVAMAVLVFCLMMPLIYPMIIGYELSYRNILKNALLMSAASLPQMVLSRLLTAIPVLIFAAGFLMGNGIMILAVILYYMLFGFSLARLIYASFANAVFDRFLNPRIKGAEVNAGLRPAAAKEEEPDEDLSGDEGDLF